MSELQKCLLAFCIIVGVSLAGGFGYKSGNHDGYKAGYKDGLAAIESKTDTVWKTDTHYVDKPIEKIRWKDKLVYVPVTDSILVEKHDTTYIALEFEKVEYADSTYRATISGFQPKLESISVYPRTAYITNTVVQREHWGASITGGPAILFNGKWHAGLGAAIGLSYNF